MTKTEKDYSKELAMMNKLRAERDARLPNTHLLVITLLVLALLITLGVVSMDNIDVDSLGVYLCEQHGLEYDTAELTQKDGSVESLVIACKEPRPERKVADGYLIIR